MFVVLILQTGAMFDVAIACYFMCYPTSSQKNTVLKLLMLAVSSFVKWYISNVRWDYAHRCLTSEWWQKTIPNIFSLKPCFELKFYSPFEFEQSIYQSKSSLETSVSYEDILELLFKEKI